MELPKLGFRNIKTGLSVFICIIFFNLIEREDCIFAIIASILCMGDTVESSLEAGKERIFGTIFGGFASLVFLWIINLIPNIEYKNPFIIATGVSFIIYMSNVFKIQNACSICCMVYISIMFNYAGHGALSYATNRTIDTLIGVVISILVNFYIKSPTPKDDDNDNKNVEIS